MDYPFKPRSLQAYVSTHTSLLQHYFTKAQQLSAYSEMLQSYLPAGLQGLCSVAAIQDHYWVIAAPSGASLTRLRFELPQLLLTLQHAGFKELQWLECLASPTLPPGNQPTAAKETSFNANPKQERSTDTIFDGLAEEIPHPRLQQAIRSLKKLF